MTRMPFGSYKGRALSELPSHYLTWLVKQPWLREPVATAARQEAKRRFGFVPVARGPARVLEFKRLAPASTSESEQEVVTCR